MNRSARARWTNAAVLVGTAVLVVVTGEGTTWLWTGVVPAMLLAAAVWASPVGDRHTLTHGEVVELAPEQRRVVVYARPGCTYCLRMRVALLGRSTPVWVDIWDDPSAAAFVREVNDGDEIVPTVVLDGDPVTNPSPLRVLDAVRTVSAA